MENIKSEVIISVFSFFGRLMGGGLFTASVPSGALLLYGAITKQTGAPRVL